MMLRNLAALPFDQVDGQQDGSQATAESGAAAGVTVLPEAPPRSMKESLEVARGVELPPVVTLPPPPAVLPPPRFEEPPPVAELPPPAPAVVPWSPLPIIAPALEAFAPPVAAAQPLHVVGPIAPAPFFPDTTRPALPTIDHRAPDVAAPAANGTPARVVNFGTPIAAQEAPRPALALVAAAPVRPAADVLAGAAPGAPAAPGPAIGTPVNYLVLGLLFVLLALIALHRSDE